MFNEWKQVLLFLPAIAVALALAVLFPYQTTSHNSSNTLKVEAPAQKHADAIMQPASTPSSSSILDDDALDRPLNYFKDAFTPDEDSSNESDPSTLVMAVKALAATLLSTIL